MPFANDDWYVMQFPRAAEKNNLASYVRAAKPRSVTCCVTFYKFREIFTGRWSLAFVFIYPIVGYPRPL